MWNPFDWTVLQHVFVHVMFIVCVFAYFGVRALIRRINPNSTPNTGRIQCGATTNTGAQCRNQARVGMLTCGVHQAQEARLHGNANNEPNRTWFGEAIWWIRNRASTTVLYIMSIQLMIVLYGMTNDPYILFGIIVVTIGGIWFTYNELRPGGVALARGLFLATAGTFNTIGYLSAALSLGLGSTVFGEILNWGFRIPVMLVIAVAWILIARHFAPYYTTEEEDAIHDRNVERLKQDGELLTEFKEILDTGSEIEDDDMRSDWRNQAHRIMLPLHHTANTRQIASDDSAHPRRKINWARIRAFGMYILVTFIIVAIVGFFTFNWIDHENRKRYAEQHAVAPTHVSATLTHSPV